jgi:hypothetical protein
VLSPVPDLSVPHESGIAHVWLKAQGLR